jgi:ferric-dicitrate binding protein FerR (iron transport regulator)
MKKTLHEKMATEEAAYWYVRCKDDALPLAERQQLSRWLQSSPSNVREFLAIKRLVHSIKRFRKWIFQTTH